jgi:iron complex outermembrane receptor protein
VEELFSNGPHAGTQAFEIGDPALRKERSTGAEVTLHADLDRFHFAGSLYANRFGRFIYEIATGAEQDELPVFAFRQAPARQWGFEVDARVDVLRRDGLTLTLDGVADYTRVTIRTPAGRTDAPRIPSLRLLGGIEAKTSKLDVRAEVERVSGQERVAAFETKTPGYTMVNLSATVRPMGQDGPLSLLFSLDNLFDVNARRHASFLKDYAPLAGRDFRASIRFEY